MLEKLVVFSSVITSLRLALSTFVIGQINTRKFKQFTNDFM